jgi:acyl-CoA thioesterase-1
MPALARVACVLATLLACEAPAPAPSGPARAVAEAPPVVDAPVIVALGTSLTAGLGLAQSEAWPALVQARLDREGYRYRVVNAGVSGDTSAGGLSRLDWQLGQKPAIVIVELGANDGLRGLPVAQVKENLGKIIARSRAAGAAVVLAGMQAPPNMGADYADSFRALFPALADEYHVPLVPFLLAGVAAEARLNQADGIHPTAEGQRIVADNVWTTLAPLLKK